MLEVLSNLSMELDLLLFDHWIGLGKTTSPDDLGLLKSHGVGVLADGLHAEPVKLGLGWVHLHSLPAR